MPFLHTHNPKMYFTLILRWKENVTYQIWSLLCMLVLCVRLKERFKLSVPGFEQCVNERTALSI